MIMRHRFLTFAAALALLSPAAFAQDNSTDAGGDSQDISGGGQTDNAIAETGAGGPAAGAGTDADVLAGFDADASGDISEEEFTAGAFGAMDMDQDQALSEDEFNEGTNRWFGEGDADFAAFDADQSGDLTEDEFSTGLGGSGLFAEFDADGSGGLDEDEFGMETGIGASGAADAEASGEIETQSQ